MAKITTKRIGRMMHELGWLYNLKIGQLIVNDKDEDGRYVSNIYIPGVYEVLRELSDRENRILWLRYSQNKTLEEVAKELNVTRERIRQIESKCLRRLRQPKYIAKVLAISESKHKAILNAKMATVEKEMTKRNGSLPKSRCETSIEELDLSVRPYNCLRRAGISTIEQLQQVPEEKLLRLRNLGRKSTEEIQSKLKEYMEEQ
ncbi:sigma-70 family RNA polymerase sigma factor [bacterium]|nr:sigma-70 family RNA polymerase sigma factor [bacterium]